MKLIHLFGKYAVLLNYKHIKEPIMKIIEALNELYIHQLTERYEIKIFKLDNNNAFRLCYYYPYELCEVVNLSNI
jgi:hypothetical protein